MSATSQTVTGFAELNGTTLYYEVAGEGHPLVLIHGGLVDNHLWDDQFATFAQHYKVIRYDMRGFGQSSLMKADDAPPSYRADLYALLKHLGIEKTYVLGLSMGGGLAIDFTLEYPEMVAALIPVAAGVSGLKEDTIQVDSAEQKAEEEIEAARTSGDKPREIELTLRFWTDGPERTPEQVDPKVREKVRAMTTHNYSRPDDDLDVTTIQLDPPALGRLGEISVPTLIIYGDADVRGIIQIAGLLQKGIPNAKTAVIPNTAHHLNLEKPEEFNRIVLDFLQNL